MFERDIGAESGLPDERDLSTLPSNVEAEDVVPPEDGTPALGQVLVKATSAEMGDNVGQLDASVRGNAGPDLLQWQISTRCP